MEEAEASRYWCHMCSQTVNPIMEMESIKCPICQSGFVEEMASAASSSPGNDGPLDFGLQGSDSDRAFSLWAPILLGMMGNSRRRRQLRRMGFEEADEDDNDNNHQHHDDGETEVDQEPESIMMRRRRRSSAAILQLLQGIRAGMLSELRNSESDNWDRERNSDRNGERVILINPFNQSIIVQGSSYDPSSQSHNRPPIGSLGDYFIGPGLDLLLQHLAENDPNRYGTPPARKEAVEALPNVKVEQSLQCSVCLDECDIGTEVKEMPCKHKFHTDCILPWLDLHSSCPVCRYQLPPDESKLDTEGSVNNSNNNSNQENNIHSNQDAGNGGGDDRNENGRRFSVPLLWPFSSLFSTSGSQSSSANSSITSPSASSTNAPQPHQTSSRADEN